MTVYTPSPLDLFPGGEHWRERLVPAREWLRGREAAARANSAAVEAESRRGRHRAPRFLGRSSARGAGVRSDFPSSGDDSVALKLLARRDRHERVMAERAADSSRTGRVRRALAFLGDRFLLGDKQVRKRSIPHIPRLLAAEHIMQDVVATHEHSQVVESEQAAGIVDQEHTGETGEPTLRPGDDVDGLLATLKGMRQPEGALPSTVTPLYDLPAEAGIPPQPALPSRPRE